MPRKSAVQKGLLAALVTILVVTYLKSSGSSHLTWERHHTERESAWLLDDSTSMEFAAGRGQIVGAHGEFLGINEGTEDPPKQVPLEKLWKPPVMSVAPAELIQGLPAFPLNNPRAAPLTILCVEADNTFRLGPTTRKAYVQSLEAFVKTSWPRSLRPQLLDGIERYLDAEEGALWRTERIGSGKTGREKNMIWMTDKDRAGHQQSSEVSSWKDNSDGWGWKLMEDA